MIKNLGTLEQHIGHVFKDQALITRALTHASFGEHNYQRLEFLGDRVVNLIVAEFLFQKFPEEAEGDLAKRHTALVCGETLAHCARKLQLNLYVRAAQDQDTDAENLMGDVMESLLAVVYLEAGLNLARTLLLSLLDDQVELRKAPPRDPKTALQEWSQSKGFGLPVYEVVGNSGPAHDPVFEVKITVAHYPALNAAARSKKLAEKKAAQLFLEKHVHD